LQIKQCAPTRRARNVIGFERATTRRLQNVESESPQLSPARFSANQNRIANAIREQSANDHGGAQQRDTGSEWRRFEVQAILEQDRVVPPEALQLCREQPKRRDRRQGDTVL